MIARFTGSTTLGGRLTAAMYAARVSQVELSKRTGISVQRIARMQRDLITPSVMVLADIARALGVTVEHLRGQLEEKAS
jgi:transcriptional regulator with XRE-family HTH domain